MKIAFAINIYHLSCEYLLALSIMLYLIFIINRKLDYKFRANVMFRM